ncbi:MAG: XrtA-associated tyrosine autokinase [Pseudomonadota bacterium]
MSSIIEKAVRIGKQRTLRDEDVDGPRKISVESVEARDSRAAFRCNEPVELLEPASSEQYPQRTEDVSVVGDAEATEPLPAVTETCDVMIPFESLNTRGFLSPLVPRSATAEEFRTIKRPVLQNLDRGGEIKHPNLVMVTSALQGDGKTYSSINLAMSIAMERDKTVLFVDADVLRATAGATLGVPAGVPGLIDLLTGEIDDPAEVILRTNVPDLRVLPAGKANEHATELLASGAMHRLMIELASRYEDRVIVFDSPPLLLTTEASVLASFMGQIVFVAAADITPQNAIKEALEHIGPDKVVGVMLNRASQRRTGLVGSYGYYGYSAYSSDRYSEAAGKGGEE